MLIVGAGEVGQFLARQIQRRWEGQHYQIVGFVDDDLTQRGMRIHGVKVLGSRRAIPTLVAQYDVDVVVIAIDNLGQREYQDIVNACDHAAAQVKVIPDVVGLIRERDKPLLGRMGCIYW